MISQPILCKSLVGRAAELDHLLARRRAAAGGKGGMVLVAGEPGIGKSRLLREFRERSSGGALRVAVAGCREFAQRPLGPVLEALTQLDPAAAEAAGKAGASQSEHTQAVVEAFAALGARRTTLIVLEDLHWADVDLMRLLPLLVEKAAHQRLLFAGSYRDNEIGPSHPLYAGFGRLLRDPATSLVRLLPLPVREMNELMRDALTGRPALPGKTIDEVRRRSDGNALFAEELLRYAVDGFTAGEDSSVIPLPHSLQAVVRERLGRCDAWQREVLSRASLFGRRFSIDLLSAIFPDPPDRYLDALARLRELQLIEPLGGDRPDFAFRHALTRDVVYGELLRSEAQPLHLRFAQAIAARPDAARHAESLAHHFWEAGEFARSAPYCAAAGDAAFGLHAYEDAAIWYERAARAFAHDGAAGAGLLVKAAQALVIADAIDRALPLYERAAEHFLEAGVIDEFVRARVMKAGPLYDSARPDEAIALLEDTCRLADGRASQAVRDRLFVRLGLLYVFKPDVENALRVVRAVDATRLDADSPLAGEYNFLMARIHALRAEVREWREATEAGLAAYGRRGQSDDFRIALSNATEGALALGELDAARAYQDRALGLAGGLKSGVDYESSIAAEVELLAGNLERAQSLLDGIATVGRFSGRIVCVAAQTMLAALTGDENLANFIDTRMIEAAVLGGQTSALVQLAGPFAFGLERLDRGREARALLARACASIAYVYDMSLTLAVTALLQPRLSEGLRPLVAAAAEPAQDRVHRALLALIDAATASERGDAAAAAAFGSEAARRYAEIGWPWFCARAYELAGDAAKALEIQRRIGALGEVRRMERAGLAGPRPAKRTSVLTERERELALLIAGGKGNRAAAEMLSITEKAVEKYLTSIYAKLGLTSRAQLAAYVAAGRSASAD